MKPRFDELNSLEPKDMIPFFVRVKRFIFGKKTDGFTRFSFSISLFTWLLLASWNAISYFVLLSTNIIEKHKAISVQKILVRNGEMLGFTGDEFIPIITSFYFYSLLIWGVVFVGLILMYRKLKIYTFFVLGGIVIQFVYILITLGVDYIINDISLFDKLLYIVLIGITIIHSVLLNREKREKEIYYE